jgi:hypothetical protein
MMPSLEIVPVAPEENFSCFLYHSGKAFWAGVGLGKMSLARDETGTNLI